MSKQLRWLATTVFLSALLLPYPSSHAAIVQIDYVLVEGQAQLDPISIPNPQGGADITITPSINVSNGSFTARLPSDDAGVVFDGDATILDVAFEGDIVIDLASTITLAGFPIPVTATLSGPLNGTQTSDSNGTLTGLTLFADTSPGLYDIFAGPLDCTDSAFGLFCTAIEGLLGIEFPITQVAADGTPIPFGAGTFSGLNGQSGGSAFAATLQFSIPIDDTNSLGTEVDFTWEEVDRLLIIPEPSTSLLVLMASSLGLILRRRR